jgi:hypothetical protein
MEYAREHLKTSENLKKVDEAVEKMRNYFRKELPAKE